MRADGRFDDPVLKLQNARRRRARALAEHRCTACMGPLPEVYAFKCCETCRSYYRERHARVRALKPQTRAHMGRESEKWKALDRLQARCECGLLLPCYCAETRQPYDRSGPGRTYPATGAW